MDIQSQMNDFTNSGFNIETRSNLSEPNQYGYTNTHKRPWPFDVDDHQLESSGPVSPSLQQPAEPLWLLGSVGNVSV